jgi:hypothetical protein
MKNWDARMTTRRLKREDDGVRQRDGGSTHLQRRTVLFGSLENISLKRSNKAHRYPSLPTGDITFALRGADTSAGILLSLMNGYAHGHRVHDGFCRRYFKTEIQRFFKFHTRGIMDVVCLLKDVRLLVEMGAWSKFYDDYNKYLTEKGAPAGQATDADSDKE